MKNIIYKNDLGENDFLGAVAIYYTDEFLIILKKEVCVEKPITNKFYLFKANDRNWKIFRKYFSTYSKKSK